jgi:hypothetical protein
MGRDCASEAFQSRWPRPIRGNPANASAEIDVAAVTVEGTLRQGLNGPARPIRRLVSRLRPLRRDEGVEGVRGLQRASRQDRASSWRRPLRRPNKVFDLCARNARAGGGGGCWLLTPCLRNTLAVVLPPRASTACITAVTGQMPAGAPLALG